MDNQWEYDVQIMSRRLATMYYYMVTSMLEELSEEQTEQIVRRAIKRYGQHWGEYSRDRVSACGLPLTPNHYDLGGDMPSRGLSVGKDLVNENHEILQEYKGCMLGKTWQELNFERWGRLYCYVDYAKFEAYNPQLQAEHQKNMLDGDDCCMLHVVQLTSEKKP